MEPQRLETDQIDKAALIAIRPGTLEDKNFILATWLRGLYYGDSWFSLINKRAFMDAYHPFLEALIKSPSTRITVSCLKDDPEVILGYSVWSVTNPAIHWVFVKSAWRKIGIAKSLLPYTEYSATHLTKAGLAYLKRNPKLSFNPFLIK